MNNVKIVPVRAKNISLCVKLYSFFHVSYQFSEDFFTFFDGEYGPAMQHHGFEIVGKDHLGREEIELRAVL